MISIGSAGYSTQMGPFYKKRGYAASQMEMRRESSTGYATAMTINPRTQVTTANNQIAMLTQNPGYERSTLLFQGRRDLGAGTGTFQIEIFMNRKG